MVNRLLAAVCLILALLSSSNVEARSDVYEISSGWKFQRVSTDVFQ